MTETETLTGPMTVDLDLASLGDADGDGLDEVSIEILSMQLTGTSALLGPLTIGIRDPAKHPFQQSKGEIEEEVNNTPGVLDLVPFAPSGTAMADIAEWFETLAAPEKLHNDVAIDLSIADIPIWPPPPGATLHMVGGPIPMVDDTEASTGVQIVSITGTFIDPAVGGLVELVSDPDSPRATSEPSEDHNLPIAASVVIGTLLLGAGGLYVVRTRRG